MTRVVIAGASVAGVATAKQLRQNGFEGDVILLSAEDHEPYDRPPLSKGFLMATDECASPVPLAEADWYHHAKVELRLNSAAVSLDPVGRRVRPSQGEELEYDVLVIATGCTPRTVTAPGFGDLPTVSALPDAQALRAHLSAGRQLVVVGSGFIALELAAVASARGVPVLVLARERGSVLRSLDRRTADYVIGAHEARGVRFEWGATITHLERRPDATRVRLSTGQVIDDAYVLAAIGSQPNVRWLTGLEPSPEGGVLCDAFGRTAQPDIYAVGDVCLPYHPKLGGNVLNRHWTNAINQATVTARVIAGVETEAVEALPYYWSDQAELSIRYSGDLTTTAVIHEDTDSRGRVAVFGAGGVVTGVVAINRPADFVRNQRKIGQSW